jgi:CHASE2 domain-containing sensor protein
VKRFDHVLASLPQLQNAAKGQALLSVALDQGVVRRIPLVLGLGTKLVPGLAMEMLRVATGSGGVEVKADGYGVQSVGVADVTVPTQPNGEIWLHFAHLSATQDRYVSAIDVLQGKVATERLENKLILLGLTGAGLNDMRTTALGELVPGIEIQAQVIETIFDGRFLQRPAWLKWAESGFILLFGLLMIWYLPKTDTRMAVFVKAVPMSSALLGFLLNLLIVLSGFFFFNRFGLLVDAVSIFIILSTVLASLVSSAITEIDQLAKDKEAQAHRARESAAYESGMQAGRRQQGPSEVPDSGVPGVGTQA